MIRVHYIRDKKRLDTIGHSMKVTVNIADMPVPRTRKTPQEAI